MEEDFIKKEIELLVLINAYEETFAQTVHARTSYLYNEIIFGAKFNTMIKPDERGAVSVKLNRVNEHEIISLFEEAV